MIKDHLESMEDAAEREYYEVLQPDGKLKCSCGRVFDPENEGGIVSPNPYSMPVCGDCLEASLTPDTDVIDDELVQHKVDQIFRDGRLEGRE